jgi:hypothetical protein
VAVSRNVVVALTVAVSRCVVVSVSTRMRVETCTDVLTDVTVAVAVSVDVSVDVTASAATVTYCVNTTVWHAAGVAASEPGAGADAAGAEGLGAGEAALERLPHTPYVVSQPRPQYASELPQ